MHPELSNADDISSDDCKESLYTALSNAFLRSILTPDFSPISISEHIAPLEFQWDALLADNDLLDKCDEDDRSVAVDAAAPDLRLTGHRRNKHSIEKELLLGWQTTGPTNRFRNLWHPINKRVVEHSLTNAVRYSGDGHCVTFAPTGSGKGVGVIIPNLLNYAGPVVVIDPKGENFAVTARYRKTSLNHRIYLLDPFHLVSDELLAKLELNRDRLNPLDLSKLTEANAENDSQMLAQLLAGDGVSLKDPFWDISAMRLVAGVIDAEMTLSKTQGRQPSMRETAKMLYNDDVAYNLAVLLDAHGKVIDRFTQQALASFLSLAEVTRSGVLATAQSYLSIIMSESLQKHLNDSTIDIDTIVSGGKYTLYIVIPPNKLQSHGVLLRIWVSMLMHAIMERRSVPEERTLFMLDECANLGNLDTLRKAVTLLRGFGLQVWMFFQDLSQLHALYAADSSTMINNCGVVQAFGIARPSSARDICRIVGGFRPDSVTRMLPTQQLLSIAPATPMFASIMRYYTHSAFKLRFDPNPLIKKQSTQSVASCAPRGEARFRGLE